MAFTLPEGLAPEVYPLAWLVGTWRGKGVVVYPNIPETAVTQEVVVDHDGGPYLRWSSTLWLAPDAVPDPTTGDDAAEAEPRVWGTEQGYWRIPPERPADVPQDRHPVELMLVDPAGHLSLYAGIVGNGRIDLASDLIARTPDAAEVSAATRLYGFVQGELMWTWDLAAFGEPLQSYASARLTRVEP
ncbi:FABP family protein [Actinotalea sp. BY-33]|uniref:Ferric nitrobindin-like protein n=1 Tax=Actinotalea soli TaxID=2819234 RepID=A0A939LRS6_9CELL|nr:FABP family protein [Actinotalea soli]MBO1753366.1 FABP family protein [Actinotalea soli]